MNACPNLQLVEDRDRAGLYRRIHDRLVTLLDNEMDNLAYEPYTYYTNFPEGFSIHVSIDHSSEDYVPVERCTASDLQGTVLYALLAQFPQIERKPLVDLIGYDAILYPVVQRYDYYITVERNSVTYHIRSKRNTVVTLTYWYFPADSSEVDTPNDIPKRY